MYGCCADGQTPAAGPDAEGCFFRITCDMTAFGCCPDGETIANGFSKEGCPPTTTTETSTSSSPKTTTMTPTTTTTPPTRGEMTRTTADVETSTVKRDDVATDTTSSKLSTGQTTSQTSVTSLRLKKGCRRRTATTAATATSTTTEFGLICRISIYIYIYHACTNQSDLRRYFLFIFTYFLICIGVYVLDICLVPLETGWCNFFYPKSFYFNNETGQCAELPSGCSVSDNAFYSLEACEQECAKHFTSLVTATTAAVNGKYLPVSLIVSPVCIYWFDCLITHLQLLLNQFNFLDLPHVNCYGPWTLSNV